MKEDYIPIACHLHDTLLDLATRGKVCEIVYIDDAGKTTTVNSGIADVFTKGKAEYLTTREGITIRLDTLVRVGKTQYTNAQSGIC